MHSAKKRFFFLHSLALSLLLSTPCFALDQIIRPYQSVRSAGMGGVRLTTGLYDENFFNNPARVTANPESKLTLFQVTPIETTSITDKAISALTAGGNELTTLGAYAGQNLHQRFQLVLPAFYLASNEDRKWAFGAALILSEQADAIIENDYQLSLSGIVDTGPALTYGRTFFEDNRLSLGITGHIVYRAAAAPNFGILNYIQNGAPTLKSLAGAGTTVDFDLGTTYRFAQFGEWNMTASWAIQNILGGTFAPFKFNPINLSALPVRQPRSYGVGTSLSRATLGHLTQSSMTFEITDILNDPNGSIYKLFHFGVETHWKSFALRGGVNQGYLTAGLGIDFYYLTLDFATYGEEMGLNAGTLEDRRYTANIGINI